MFLAAVYQAEHTLHTLKFCISKRYLLVLYKENAYKNWYNPGTISQLKLKFENKFLGKHNKIPLSQCVLCLSVCEYLPVLVFVRLIT